ncbi:Abi family protein [Carnobacterium maltaromaticum]|uniref:Abi family protein n=1 Tax=Carnobacterium maltaromaticum TaxID=2751 RepID=UPI0039AF33A8
MKQLDKPFCTLEEQISILRNRGLIIDSDNIELVNYSLTSVGYYPLINGYHKPFLNGAIYEQGVRFEHIYYQYQLDNALHNICFKYIINIENTLKNTISYQISEKFNVENNFNNHSVKSYLDKSNYDTNGPVYILKQIIESSEQTKNNPTAYYRENKNHIPPWVLLKNIPLGQVNLLFKILPSKMKQEIIDNFISIPDENYQLKVEMFNNSLDIIREFRNCIAHSYRLYAFKSKKSLSKQGIKLMLGPDSITTKEYSNGIGTNDFLALLYSITILTSAKHERANFILELENFERTYINKPTIYSTFLNSSQLPTDYLNRIRKGDNFRN